MNDVIAAPSTDITAQQKTLVTFLLDRSGSMEACRDMTIVAFNEYLDGLTVGDAADLIAFTLVTFDSEGMDKVCVAVPINKAPKLNRSNYVPRAGTPLIDAAVKTIKAVEASLNMRGNPKVIVCIQTDGQENQSREHTWEELKALVTQKTAEGWQFNFMGAGIDAYDQGAKMGIAAGATMSYDKASAARTSSAFRSSAARASMYARGKSVHTHYSAQDKLAAGDEYDPDLNPSKAKPSAPQQEASSGQPFSLGGSPKPKPRGTKTKFTLND